MWVSGNLIDRAKYSPREPEQPLGVYSWNPDRDAMFRYVTLTEKVYYITNTRLKQLQCALPNHLQGLLTAEQDERRVGVTVSGESRVWGRGIYASSSVHLTYSDVIWSGVRSSSEHCGVSFP